MASKNPPKTKIMPQIKFSLQETTQFLAKKVALLAILAGMPVVMTFLALSASWNVDHLSPPPAKNNADKTISVKLPDFSHVIPQEITVKGNKLLTRHHHEVIKIPKVLHQTWKKVDNLPPKYARYRETWVKMHPNWTHHLWTDEENRELVRRYYPWLLAAYDAFPVGVMRADTSHYLQMHQYGGMYADLDMEPLRPLDFLIDNATHPVTLGYMSDNYQDFGNIQPGFIISEPGHPLWLVAALKILATFESKSLSTRPDYITGPVMFYEAIRDYVHMFRTGRYGVGAIESGSPVVYDLRILAPGLIYPFHWKQAGTDTGLLCSGNGQTQNETACKALFPNAYTIQYSSYSWRQDWEGFLSKNKLAEANG